MHNNYFIELFICLCTSLELERELISMPFWILCFYALLALGSYVFSIWNHAIGTNNRIYMPYNLFSLEHVLELISMPFWILCFYDLFALGSYVFSFEIMLLELIT